MADHPRICKSSKGIKEPDLWVTCMSWERNINSVTFRNDQSSVVLGLYCICCRKNDGRLLVKFFMARSVKLDVY